MKAENREAMERAIGIIIGASYGSSQRVQDALALAEEMLEAVLKQEERDG